MFVYYSYKYIVEVNVKLFLFLATHHAMKTYGEWRYGSTHYYPRYYTDVSGRLHTPEGLSRGKRHRYQLDRKLLGPQSRFACCSHYTDLAILATPSTDYHNLRTIVDNAKQ
jgi:hypothetical protein